MKTALSAGVFVASFSLIFSGPRLLAQNRTEVRRAQPVDEAPVSRPSPNQPPPNSATQPPPAGDTSEATPVETVPPAQRQLEYAGALFGRKMYDLAVPEF